MGIVSDSTDMPRSQIKTFISILLGTSILALLSLLYAGPRSGKNPKVISDEDAGLLIVGTIINSENNQNIALLKHSKTGSVKAVRIGFKFFEYTIESIHEKYLIARDIKENNYLLIYRNVFAPEFLDSNKFKKNVPGQGEEIERYKNTIRLTARFRDHIVEQKLQSVLMDATVLPHKVNDIFVGFRLFQITKGSLYEKAGFKNDDIITSINGSKLENISSAIKILHSLKKADKIQIDYIRAGVEQTSEIIIN